MRVIALLVAALLAASPVYAGANIVQKGSGATVWQDADGVQVPAGDSGIAVYMPNISTASTVYVLSRKKGNLVAAYVVNSSQGVGQNTLDFAISNANTDGWFDPVTGTASTSVGTLRVTNATGTVSSLTFVDVSVAVAASDAIAIHTDGSGTAGSDDTATIYLFIE